MFPIKRALLIINRKAGTGVPGQVADQLALLFKQSLDQLSEVKIESVADHAEARTCAAQFFSKSEAPAFVVVGGGGGTLRGVIEGICDSRSPAKLPGPHEVRIATLRMGSGNLLARQLGVPRDPIVALDGLLTNLKADRTVPCCVMRCETWTSSGKTVIHHAVSMGGLGQFGRVPSDLARRHARFPFVHKTAAWFGIEKVNNVEYVLTLFLRSLSCLLPFHRAEMVEVQFHDQKERFRLLSGIVMNFPIDAVPLNPRVTVVDEALSVYLVAAQPLIPRLRHIRIEKSQRLEMRIVDRNRVEFFLDEDPVTTYGQLSLEVVGSIAFVPGPDYQGDSA